jgi:hypothetical protein
MGEGETVRRCFCGQPPTEGAVMHGWGWIARRAHPAQLLPQAPLVGPHGECLHAHARAQPQRLACCCGLLCLARLLADRN